MLHEFIVAERARLVAACDARMTSERGSRAPSGDEGIGPFLDQLVEVLVPDSGYESQAVGALAARHATALMRRGYSLGEVIHAYGNVCQAITALAIELRVFIATTDFQTLNRCLDDAIAGAVVEYVAQRDRGLALDASEKLLRIGDQMRSLLGTAKTALDAIKQGTVGPGGETGAMLGRNLLALERIIDGPLSDVHLAAGATLTPERISLQELVGGLQASISMQASNRGCELVIDPIDPELAVDADRQILTSALSALLQKAVASARPESRVSLAASGGDERVVIEISGESAGPMPQAEERRGSRRLPSIRRSDAEVFTAIESALCVTGGEFRVRKAAGSRRTFTIDLPRL